MLKKLLLKLSLLVVILIITNFIYTRWLFESDIQKHSAIVNLVREIPQDADIIYIGESSNTTYREDDLDKRPISGFLGEFYPSLNTYDITKPASHAGIYKELLKQIPENNKVQTLVVTLNMRSFNASWINSDLETPLLKSLVLLRPNPPLINRFMLSFKDYEILTKKERDTLIKEQWAKDKFHFPYEFPFNNVIEWDQWMAENGVKDSLGNLDQAKTELACHYIKTYGFQIDTTSNPRINDFNEIIDFAQKRSYHLVFNLMAENTEKAEQLVGEDLLYLMNSNAQLLEHYFTNKGITVVNNLHKVDNEQFIDQHWTTEHYAEKGRKIIASEVALALQKWHKEAYQEVDLTSMYQSYFYNNCEDKYTTWSQKESRTQQLARSGHYSSKTGNGNDFSLTLEYPLKVIPDSLKSKVNISCWVHQSEANNIAKLMFQASVKDFSFYSKEFTISDQIQTLNHWQLFEAQINIPDSIKNADVFKVYIYNPGSSDLFVDDFEIKFLH